MTTGTPGSPGTGGPGPAQEPARPAGEPPVPASEPVIPAHELYYQALSGQAAAIEMTAAGGPRAFPDTATTLRLPACPVPGARLGRRAWYRVALAHRALHQEAGTFGFRLARADMRIAAALGGQGGERDGDGGPGGRAARQARNAGGRSDLEVFLGSFADRRLALQVFETLEDLRIDTLLRRRYPGLAADLAAISAAERAARPDLATMAPRAAALEFLIRRSLAHDDPGHHASVPGAPGSAPGHEPPRAPAPIAEPAATLLAVAGMASRPDATVEDVASAAVHAYAALSHLPNLGRLGDAPQMRVSRDDAAPLPWPRKWPEEARVIIEGDAVLDVPASPVSFRDELAGRIWAAPAPAAPNEQSVYIWHPAPAGAAGPAAPAAPVTMAGPPEPLPHEHHDVTRDLRRREDGPLSRTGPHTFLYPEWDDRRGTYLPRWCRVIERPFTRSDDQAVHQLQRRHQFLLTRLRRLMQNALPAGLEPERRTTDGDDIDFDAAVEALQDLRAGRTPGDALYQRLRRRKRDVAVGILVDASSSTGERVEGAPPLDPESAATPGYRRWPRVLDVEIVATMLCLTAIDAVGDASAAWAFSGTGRESVDMPVLKALGEPFSGRVIRRTAAVKPLHATRMGAAIRHAAARLAVAPHAAKLLIVLSDGRPYDVDYGQQYGDEDAAGYAAADTAHAIGEARRVGVRPFLLTVDHGGEDYLARICARDYQILDDIAALPERLTGLYRGLTAGR
jgi:nitric oxide reductase NorD protein